MDLVDQINEYLYENKISVDLLKSGQDIDIDIKWFDDPTSKINEQLKENSTKFECYCHNIPLIVYIKDTYFKLYPTEDYKKEQQLKLNKIYNNILNQVKKYLRTITFYIDDCIIVENELNKFKTIYESIVLSNYSLPYTYLEGDWFDNNDKKISIVDKLEIDINNYLKKDLNFVKISSLTEDGVLNLSFNIYN
jgi:hypothetical protein